MCRVTKGLHAIMAETELEMAQRHVRRGDELIAHQRRHAAELRSEGDARAAEAADQLLIQFVALQAQNLAHLRWVLTKR